CGTKRNVRAAARCEIAGVESADVAVTAPAPAAAFKNALRSMTIAFLLAAVRMQTAGVKTVCLLHQSADMPQCGCARQWGRRWLQLRRKDCLSHGVDDSPRDLWRNPDRCAPAATAEARVQDQQARARSLRLLDPSKLREGCGEPPVQEAEAGVQLNCPPRCNDRLFVSSEQEICEPDDALRDVVHGIERAETDRAFAPIDSTLGVAPECSRRASE